MLCVVFNTIEQLGPNTSCFYAGRGVHDMEGVGQGGRGHDLIVEASKLSGQVNLILAKLESSLVA